MQEETGRVIFHTHDQFISHLQELGIQDNTAETNSKPGTTTYGKYKVQHSVATLTAEELKVREDAAFGMLDDMVRKNNKRN